MRFTQLSRFVAVAALAIAFAAPAARADTVRDWNQNALDALTNAPTAAVPGAGQTPPVSAQYVAMVQGAVYDAVNAIAGGYQPYLVRPHATPFDSQDAAAATAAHDVLMGATLMPPFSQAIRDRIDALYAATMAGIPDGPAKDGGVAAGAAAAAAMLAARADDGRYVPFHFREGTGPGEWRPDLPLFISDPFAWVGNVRPFLLQDAAQVRTPGPNEVTSHAYAVEFNEVKDLGSATSVHRTADQTAIALFFTQNPIQMWNRSLGDIAAGQGLTTAQEARLFGMVNLAAADGLIGCWNDKAYWSFWRPITAIRNADTDDNPDTAADPDWLPLIPNPPYPDHPSGYNCVSGSFLYTAQAFFGTNQIPITAHSNVTNSDRSYDTLTAPLRDTIDARVWEGIHFRKADVDGAALGGNVARWLQRNYFQPLP